MKNFKILSLGLFTLVFMLGCQERTSMAKGVYMASLQSCDQSKHPCLSSVELPDKDTYVEPIKYPGPKNIAQDKLVKILLKTPGGRIIKLNPDYIQFEVTMPYLNITDDLEFMFRPGSDEIIIRSESRLAFPDILKRMKNRIEEIKFKFFQNDVN